MYICPICEHDLTHGIMPRNHIIPDELSHLEQPRQRKFKPIYKPSGRAYEYAEYACNIYTGCDNGCYYCYAPKTLRVPRLKFENVQPRIGIVTAVREQLSSAQIRGKLVGLCFTCDPYPRSIDNTPTREIIKAIKMSGNHVQILTKNPINRDFDLLNENDWFGVTLTGRNAAAKINEPNALESDERMSQLFNASAAGIKTWISLEPVLDPQYCYDVIKYCDVDLIRIGKLNYYPSEIDWKEFGQNIEILCKKYRRDYYLKDDLRALMERG